MGKNQHQIRVQLLYIYVQIQCTIESYENLSRAIKKGEEFPIHKRIKSIVAVELPTVRILHAKLNVECSEGSERFIKLRAQLFSGISI